MTKTGGSAMQIADIMTKQVHTIGPDRTLEECARTLKKHKLNGLVVLDGDVVAGVITKTDIFRSILPGYSDIIEDERHIASLEYIEERVHRLSDLKVRDIMGAPPITVGSDMRIVKAGSLMLLRKIKQLPVVDNGRLAGIVTLTDIINSITEKVK